MTNNGFTILEKKIFQEFSYHILRTFNINFIFSCPVILEKIMSKYFSRFSVFVCKTLIFFPIYYCVKLSSIVGPPYTQGHDLNKFEFTLPEDDIITFIFPALKIGITLNNKGDLWIAVTPLTKHSLVLYFYLLLLTVILQSCDIDL